MSMLIETTFYLKIVLLQFMKHWMMHKELAA